MHLLRALAPFRYNSKGYTGQKRYSDRRYIQYSVELLERETKRIEKTCQSMLLSDAKSITQYYRGWLYSVADCIMECGTIEESHFPKVILLHKKLLGLIAKFFGELTQYIPFLVEGYKYKNLYLADKRVALAMSWFEIVDILKMYFLQNARVIEFYKHPIPKRESWKFAAGENKSDTKPLRPLYEITTEFVETFAELNGFDNILLLIEKNLEYFPIEMIIEIISVFQGILKYFSKTYLESIIQRITKIMDSKIANISEKEVKIPYIGFGFECLLVYYKILKLGVGKDQARSIYESAILKLCIKMIKCSTLEKQLKAVNHLKQIIDTLDSTMSFKPKVAKALKIKWLTINTLISTLKECNILNIIYKNSSHTELLKRSTPITCLFAKKGLGTDDVKLLWEFVLEKHEEVERVMYEALTEIITSMNIENILQLLQLSMQLPFEKYNNNFLNFAHILTTLCFARIPFSVQPNESKGPAGDDGKGAYIEFFKLPLCEEAKQFYFIPLLYMSLLDSSPLKPPISNVVLNHLVNIITTNSHAKKLSYKIVMNCMHRVHEVDSVPYCCDIIYEVIKLDRTNSFDAKDYEKIVSTTMQSITAYIEKSNQAGVQNKTDTVGKTTHEMQIITRLKLIEIAFKKLNKDIGADNLKVLLDAFHKSKNEFDIEILSLWITASYSSAKSSETSLCIKDCQSMLLLLIGYMDIVCQKLYLYNLFIYLFQIVNSSRNALFVRKQIIRLENKDMLLYYNELWGIMSKTQNIEIANKIKEYLCTIHLHLQPINHPQRFKIWTGMVDNCLKGILQSSQLQNELGICSCISMLAWFFNLFDGSIFNEEEPKTEKHVYSSVVYLKPDNKQSTIPISFSTRIGDIRKRIALIFQLHINDFTLMTIKNTQLDFEEDNQTVRNLSFFPEHFYALKNSGELINEENHPKCILAQNEEYINLLFSLATNENKAYTDALFSLFTILPTNKKIQSSIVEMKMKVNHTSWEELLGSNSYHRMLYSLQIIEKIVYEAQNAPDFWLDMFEQKGGIQFLISIINKLEPSSMKSIVIKKIAASIFNIIRACVDNKQQVKNEAFVQQIILLINAHGIAWCEKEKALLSSIEKPSRKSVNYALASLNNDVNDELDLINKAIFLLKPLFANSHYNVDSIIHTDVFKQMLTNLLLKPIHSSFRECSYKFLKYLFITKVSNPQLHKALFEISFPELENIGNHSNPLYFIKYMSRLLCECNKKDIDAFNVKEIIKKTTEMIKSHCVVERTESDIDDILNGLFTLLKTLILRYPQYKQFVGQELKLVEEILGQCLFDFPSGYSKGNSLKPPKCKNASTRARALKLLFLLCKQCTPNLKATMEYLLPMHLSGNWRTSSYSDWECVEASETNNVSGFVGIKNLGCICYMNSLIQQLFMIQTFREGVLSIKVQPSTQLEENTLYQFQFLLASLRESEKPYINPKAFCKTIKNLDNHPINLYEQMDAEEFFNMFMDKLEKYIKGTEEEQIIKQHFGGEYANQLICKDCPHSSERDEPFIAVNLQIKNKKNILQSLDSFIQGEMLEGDNAYFCEKCDKKVATLKRACIKTLPKHLIFVLKRFEFNYDTMQKVKLNDYCEFPDVINMEPYTIEGLASKEKSAQPTEENSEENDSVQKPKGYYEYKLRGIVIHMGCADSGHYYSIIQDLEGKWYEFNDCVVEQFDPNEIPHQAYGGEDKWCTYAGEQKYEKIRNAYMLFYERSNDMVSEKNYFSTPMRQQSHTTLDAVLFKSIIDENIKYWQAKSIFTREYFSFLLTTFFYSTGNPISDYSCPRIMDDTIKKMLSNGMSAKQFANVPQCCFSYKNEEILDEVLLSEFKKDAKSINYNLFKFTASVFLTTFTRYKGSDKLIYVVDLIKSYINSSEICAFWILNIFTNTQIQSEFFIDCIHPERRELIGGIVICAIYKTFEKEKEITFEKSFIAKFFYSFIHLIHKLKEHPACTEAFYTVFLQAALLSPEIRKMLIEKQFIKILIEYNETDGFSAKSTAALLLNNDTKIELDTQKQIVEYTSFLEEYRAKLNKKDQMNQMPINEPYLQLMSITTRCFDFQNQKGNLPDSALQPYNLFTIGNDMGILKNIKWFIHHFNNQIDKHPFTNSKKTYHMLADAISHICYNNVDNSNITINFLCEEIPVLDKGYRKLLYLTIKQCLIRDNFQEQRLNMLNKYLFNEKQEYRPLEYKTTFLCSIAEAIPMFKKYFQEHPKIISKLIAKCNSSIEEIDTKLTSVRAKMNIYKNMESVHICLKRKKLLINTRLNTLKEISNDATPITPFQYDSDTEVSSHKFVANEKIEIKKREKLFEHKEVVSANDEYLIVKTPSTSKQEWISTKSDILALDNSYSKSPNYTNDESELNELYSEEYLDEDEDEDL